MQATRGPSNQHSGSISEHLVRPSGASLNPAGGSNVQRMVQEAGRERNPNTGIEALVVTLLEPVAWRVRRRVLELEQNV